MYLERVSGWDVFWRKSWHKDFEFVSEPHLVTTAGSTTWSMLLRNTGWRTSRCPWMSSPKCSRWDGCETRNSVTGDLQSNTAKCRTGRSPADWTWWRTTTSRSTWQVSEPSSWSSTTPSRGATSRLAASRSPGLGSKLTSSGIGTCTR